MWTCIACGSSFRMPRQRHSCDAGELHGPEDVDEDFVRWMRHAFERGMKH